MLLRSVVWSWCFLLLASAGAQGAGAPFANAGLPAGGIEVARSDAIAIERMDVTISQDEIRIDYLLKNKGQEPIESEMFFQLPELEGSSFFPEIVPNDRHENFLDFELIVDGQTVQPELEQHAFAHGIDVTRDLRALAYQPLLPVGAAVLRRIQNTNAPVLERLLTRGIIHGAFYDAGNGAAFHYSPAWQLKSTFFWKISMERGDERNVSVRYKPVFSTTERAEFFTDYRSFRQDIWDDLDEKYCLGESYWTDLETTDEENISRIIQSGLVLELGQARASGPVGEFSMKIVGQAPGDMVGLCAQGFTRIEPGVYRFFEKNYLLPDRFEILFLKNMPQ